MAKTEAMSKMAGLPENNAQAESDEREMTLSSPKMIKLRQSTKRSPGSNFTGLGPAMSQKGPNCMMTTGQ